MKTVVLAYCRRDKHQAARLLSWLLQLGFARETYGKGARLILAHSRNCDIRGLDITAHLAFEWVDEFIPHDENEAGWWVSSNHLWWRTVEYADRRGIPFLWLEPDVVPLRADFLDLLSAEYESLPRGSMLARIATLDLWNALPVAISGRLTPTVPAPALTGVAIYPPETRQIVGELDIIGPPFDEACSKVMLPHCHPTQRIIQLRHPFRRVSFQEATSFPAGACLFHGCKSGAVIRYLTWQSLGNTTAPIDAQDNEHISRDGLTSIERARSQSGASQSNVPGVPASAFRPQWASHFLGRAPRTILDVGSYDGADAIRLKKTWPSARVLAIEADPSNFARMQQAGACVAAGVEIFHYAVADGSQAEIEFIPSGGQRNWACSGSILQPTPILSRRYPFIRFLSPVKVPAIRLDSFCAQQGIREIDLVHMDIQGAEGFAIRGLGDLRPALLFLETDATDEYAGAVPLPELRQMMMDRGYELRWRGPHDDLWGLKSAQAPRSTG